VIRVWLICRPNARAAVNAALGAVNPAWANTMVAQFPRGNGGFGAPPAAKLYVAGWQDTPANLQAARAALQGVAGIRAFHGAAWGLESEESAEADHTAGDPSTTRYRRRAAIKAAIAAMGLNVPDEDIP